MGKSSFKVEMSCMHPPITNRDNINKSRPPVLKGNNPAEQLFF